MTVFAYCTRMDMRSSLNDQIDKIKEIYNDAFVITDSFYEDEPRSGFQSFLKKAVPGDVIVCTDPERLFYKPEFVSSIVYKLLEKGIKWEILSIPYCNSEFYDKYSINYNPIELACAQLEESVRIRLAIKEKNKNARRIGYIQAETDGKVGRPDLSREKLELLKQAIIDKEKGDNTSVTDICKELGIGRTSYYKYRKEFMSDMLSNE